MKPYASCGRTQICHDNNHASLLASYSVQVDHGSHECLEDILQELHSQIIQYYAAMSSFMVLCINSRFWMQINVQLVDIPIADEMDEAYHHEQCFNHNDSFIKNDEAKTNRNLTKDELHCLIALFNLPVQCSCPCAS